LANGRITAGADQLIDPAEADQQWAAATDVTKPRNSVTGAPKLRRAEPAAAEQAAGTHTLEHPANGVGENGALRAASSYAASRGVRESYMARMAKLEFEERSGKLVDADEVRAQLFGLGRRLRDAMLGVPDRIAPVLVGQSDQAAIHRLLTEEIMTSLAELSTAPAVRLGNKPEGSS
jgi:hypothetical protein